VTLLLRERYNRVYKCFRSIDQSGVRFAAVFVRYTVVTRIIIIIIIAVVYVRPDPVARCGNDFIHTHVRAGVCVRGVQCALSGGGDLISVKTGDPIGVETH